MSFLAATAWSRASANALKEAGPRLQARSYASQAKGVTVKQNSTLRPRAFRGVELKITNLS
jgi:hypothetical protein